MLMSKYPDSAGEVTVLHLLTKVRFYVKLRIVELLMTHRFTATACFAIWNHTVLPST